jgi:uncharacterized delta-60 repeat protein
MTRLFARPSAQGRPVPHRGLRLDTLEDRSTPASISGSASIAEGANYTLNLSATPAEAASILQWTINWGDGTGDQVVPGDTTSVPHVYPDGPRTQTVRATYSTAAGTFPAASEGGSAQTSVDPAFGIGGEALQNSNGSTVDNIRAAVRLPDGKLLVAGRTSGGGYDIALARYTSTGVLDTSFGTGGRVTTDFGPGESVSALALLPDGKFLVGGSFGIARYLPDGALDMGFGSGGRLTSFSYVQHLVVHGAGANARITVADGSRLGRFTLAGAADLTFDTDGIVNSPTTFNKFAVADDGSVATVGYRSIPLPVGYDYETVIRKFRADGAIDQTFGAAGQVVFNHSTAENANWHDRGQDILIRDNKVLVGGYTDDRRFDAQTNQSQTFGQSAFLLRFNADGSPDTTFNGTGRVLYRHSGNFDYMYGMAHDAAGRILAEGQYGIYRFSAAGALDTGFGTSGAAPRLLNSGSAFAFDSDGKIYLAGSQYGGSVEGWNFAVQRLTEAGATDLTYGVGGTDGNGVVSTDFQGALADGSQHVVVRQGDKVLVVGYRESGTSDLVLMRYTAAGGLDATFGVGGTDGDGIVITDFGSNEYPSAAAVDAAGRIYVAFSSSVARYTADGALDTTFGTGGRTFVSIFDIRSLRFVDGKLVAGGRISQSAGQGLLSSQDYAVARYLAPTTTLELDSTFGRVVSGQTRSGIASFDLGATTATVRADQYLRDLAVDGAGRAVFVGYGSLYNPSTGQGSQVNQIARLTAAGDLDPTFGAGTGVVTTTSGSVPNQVVVDPTGGILVGAYNTLRRYTAAGDLDTTFGSQGTATAANGLNSLTIDGNGRIVGGGSGYLYRWTPAGLPDTTFGPEGRVTLSNRTAVAVALDGSGRIVAVGQTSQSGPTGYDAWVSRYVDGGLAVSVTNVSPQGLTITGPTSADEGATVSLSAAATDPGGTNDPLTYAWTIYRNSSLYLQASGASIEFQVPDNGTYQANVTVSDGDGGQASRSHEISVTNVAPTATLTAPATGTEGSPVTVALGDPADASAVDAAAGFTYAFDFGGGYGKFSAASSAAFDPDDNGTYTVKGMVRDKDSGTREYTASVTVANAAPVVAITGAPATGTEGVPVTLGRSVTDPGIADTHTFAWTVTRDGDPFATGTGAAFAFTPTGGGTYAVTLVATDDDGATATDARSIAVTAVNDAPVANPQAIETAEDTAFNGTVTATDPDGPSPTFSLVGDPDHGTAVVNSNGSFTYTPAADYSGTDSFEFQVTDGQYTSVATVTVNVTAVNDAPTDVALDTSEVAENAAAGTVVGSLSAADVDDAAFTFALVAGTGSADNAQFEIVGDQLRTAQPLDFEAGATRSVRVRATDADGATFEKSLTITVAGVNEGPTLTVATEAVSGTEAALVANTGTFGDPDAGDAVTVSASVGTVSTDGNTWTWTHTPEDDVTDQVVTITATDAGGLSASQTFTFTAVNAPPTAGADAASTPEETAISIAVLDNDTDPAGANDPRSVSAYTQPANGTVTLAGGTFTYTPAPDFNGSDEFTYTVSDGDGGSATGTVSITVTPVNDAPTAPTLSAATLAENQPVGTVVGLLSTTDIDSTAFAFDLVAGAGDADNAAFVIVGNELRTAVVFNRETKASLSIRVRTTDGGLTADSVIPLTVLDAPEATAASGTTDGVSWAYNPTTDILTVTGRTVADTIAIDADGDVLKLTANGPVTTFDGQGGPVIFAHAWNHPQLVDVNARGGNDTVSLAALSATAYERAALAGEAGTDTLTGGAGSDTLAGGTGTDTQDGKGGSDTYAAAGTDALLDAFSDAGPGGTDTLLNTGTGHLDVRGFSSTNGIDVVDGNGSAVRGDNTANTLDFRNAQLRNLIYVDGADGNDLIYTSDVPVVAGAAPFQGYFGDDHNDTLIGGGAADLLFGEAGADSLVGGAGDDTMGGGAGTDTLDGAVGSDTYAAIAAEAVLDVMADSGSAADTDTLKNVGGPYLGAPSTHLDLRGFAPANGIDVVDGGGFAVRGDTTANVLDFRGAELRNLTFVDGRAGNDTIYASHLPVTYPSFQGYFGDDGNDTLTGGTAAAKLFGENGNDRLIGGDGADTLVGGAGTDTMTGGLGNDVFYADLVSGPAVNDDTNNNGIDDDEESLVPSFIG